MPLSPFVNPPPPSSPCFCELCHTLSNSVPASFIYRFVDALSYVPYYLVYIFTYTLSLSCTYSPSTSPCKCSAYTIRTGRTELAVVSYVGNALDLDLRIERSVSLQSIIHAIHATLHDMKRQDWT